MTLEEAIKYEEKMVDDHNRIKQIKAVTLEECECAEKHIQIADWLKALKDIQSTGSCNTCKSRRMCEYEPEAGQMTRFNCPFYKEEIEVNDYG